MFEAALSLILTEAVTNILRHSNASQATISTARSASLFTLFIVDNGSNVLLAQGRDIAVTQGNGLQGIKERVAVLRAQMKIVTDDGFHLEISMGLENHD